jgi:Holin of 3TMs, for gene-transfer release
MEWKDVAGAVGKFAPMLGSLLGGPAGAVIGGVVSSALGTDDKPLSVSKAIAENPDAALKLAQIEADHRIKWQELAVDQAKAEIALVAQQSGDVNKTMQTEAASEHWPTYSWRPFIGFAVGINVLLSSIIPVGVFLAVIFGSQSSASALGALPMVLGALAAVNGTVLPILGIASWFRGKAQADPSIPTSNKG